MILSLMNCVYDPRILYEQSDEERVDDLLESGKTQVRRQLLLLVKTQHVGPRTASVEEIF